MPKLGILNIDQTFVVISFSSNYIIDVGFYTCIYSDPAFFWKYQNIYFIQF